MINRAGERIEQLAVLDRIARPVAAKVSAALGRTRLKDLLSGSWLGHPLHPLLTDLPIGAWTSAMLLDLMGGRRAAPAADLLVAAGIAAAVPTAASGISDWSDLGQRDQRVGLVHAAANVIGIGFYTASLIARLGGRRPRGVGLSLVGAAALTAGGLLGGHLVYRRGAGVDHTTFDNGPQDWTRLDVTSELTNDQPVVARAGDVDVMVVKHGERLCGLADRCTHQGGPLHEGELVDGRVRCPWHASEFRLSDGAVLRGPATAPQPTYEVRVEAGALSARAASEGA